MAGEQILQLNEKHFCAVQKNTAQERMSHNSAVQQVGDREFEELVSVYKKSLLACASRTVHHFVTEHDEEWSVTLQAFYEAVCSHDPGRGDLWPYASVVIRRRLTDYLRGLYRYREEEQGEVPETAEDESGWPGADSIADEIEAVQGELAEYGFSFFDLTEASPKSAKSRNKCAKAAAALLGDRRLADTLKRTKALPMKRLIWKSGVSGKTLERHRKYIIAVMVILEGDYPLLAEYLHSVREEMRS